MGKRIGIWSVVIVLSTSSGCSAADAIDGEDSEDDVAPSAGTTSAALSGPQTIFVDFSGPTIESCPNPCSDAVTNRSYIVHYAWGTSSKNFAAYTDSAGRTAIVSHLRTIFGKYDVTITTTRPASGPYTRVVITPTTWAHHGIAPLDCGNANKSDIAFVLHTGDTGFYTSYAKIAQAAAHELGHSFGLAHVKNTADIMEWASSGTSFGEGYYDTAHPSGKCIPGDYQHDGKLLTANIGLK